MFSDIEESLITLIKSSFIDNQKKDGDFEVAFNGMKKSDSDPDLVTFDEELTEW